MTGLLKVGVPKTWEESKKDLAYIRKAGVRQFISTYNRVRDLKGDELLWVRLRCLAGDPFERARHLKKSLTSRFVFLNLGSRLFVVLV